MGEIHRRLRLVYLAKARNLSHKAQKNDNDNAIRKINNKKSRGKGV